MYLIYFLNIDTLVFSIGILIPINIYIHLKNVYVIDMLLNIDIHASNTDTFPEILNDILSLFWKQGKYILSSF